LITLTDRMRFFLLLFAAGSAFAQSAFRLEQLDLARVRSLDAPMGYPAAANRSVAGKPLTIHGKVYAAGVGLHSGSVMWIDLKGAADKFEALAGVDDAATALPRPLPGSALPRGLQNHPGTGRVEIWLDGKPAFDTGVMRRDSAARPVKIDLTGKRRMAIVVTDGGRWPYNNPVDLADAVFTARSKPAAMEVPPEPLPEVAKGTGAAPVIHPPRIVGASAGKPFLFRIPATGQGPLRFAAANLPPGIRLDPDSGILSGAPQPAGRTVARLTVSSAKGKDARDLTIVVGDRPLALTPPLGWNSWNVWARAVDDGKVRDAAGAMVKSGLAAHGYSFIGIDDAWMGERGADGEIHTDPAKFPDMKALADYVHTHGLKLGIYSSPGPKTCQQLEGSYRHEAQDAASYARWGIDLLKYDLCSYGQMLGKSPAREEEIKPFRVMGEAIRQQPRDIVYSLCQYGRADVWQWGPEVGGQMWRTTGDIRDSWESMAEIGFGQAGHERWAGPGRWNDTDMMVLGHVGWGVELHKSRLSPNEEMTHIGLWTLLAAPILLGCDLSQIDPFTLALLTNDDVLEIHQDPLGKQAGRVWRDGLLEGWAKPLADGTVAIGLFNRGIEPATASMPMAAARLSGRLPVRDVWRRRDAGEMESSIRATVAPHGMAFLRVGRPRR
jgi:alpha-galactosidase